MKKTINSILLLTLILSCNFIQTISVFANEIEPSRVCLRQVAIHWSYGQRYCVAEDILFSNAS